MHCCIRNFIDPLGHATPIHIRQRSIGRPIDPPITLAIPYELLLISFSLFLYFFILYVKMFLRIELIFSALRRAYNLIYIYIYIYIIIVIWIYAFWFFFKATNIYLTYFFDSPGH